MKHNLSIRFFVALTIISCLGFYSCIQKKQPVPINIGPLPVIHSDLINPQICHEHVLKLKEIEDLIFRKQFTTALKIGATIVEAPCSRALHLQTLVLIGDIFNQRKEDINAFYFYVEALELEKTKFKIQVLIKKIASVASHMKAQKILSLLASINNKDLQGQILFQSGLSKIKLGDEAKAVFLLDKFSHNFLKHKDRGQAQLILKRINEKNNFKKTTIGVLLPLSGYFGPAGQRALNAIQIAVKEFNHSGNKPLFHLSVKDTASDPAIAVRAVKALEKEKVACIIGPMITAQAAAIESNALGIPMITMSQKSDLTRVGPYILRNFMTPKMQIRTGVSYFLETYGYTRFAILYPNEKYGISFKDAFINVISKYDAQLSAMVSYEPSQTDFSEQINQFIIGYQKIAENGEFVDIQENEKKKRNKIYRAKIDFDVLFIPDTANIVNMIAPQLRYHGIKVELMGTNLWNSQKLLQAKDYVQEAIFPDGFYPDSESERVINFISSYLEITGDFPQYTEAIAYDTAKIVMEALSSPAVTSRNTMIAFFQSNTFAKGVTCATSFDLQGEPVNSLELFQVIGNEIKRIRSCEN